MAEKLAESEFWLPAEFLDDDFFLNESRAAAASGEIEANFCSVLQIPSFPPMDSMTETESDEEDHIAGLTRQMAYSFLADNKTDPVSNTEIMATSPQSTLCDTGLWSASSRGSSNIASPPLTPLEQRKDETWNLLYAASEVVWTKQKEDKVHGCGLRIPPNKSSASNGFHSNSFLAYQQLQAAQFYQMKQQQLIKQQLSAAWRRQNIEATAALRNSLPFSAWPLQRQQPASSMRTVFLNVAGARREPAGTGVFLPRRNGSYHDSRKKSEMVSFRGNAGGVPSQKRHNHLPPSPATRSGFRRSGRIEFS